VILPVLWRPKRGRVLTEGRAFHLAVGCLVPLAVLLRTLLHALTAGVEPKVALELAYNHFGWTCAGMAAAAIGWEMITPALSGPMGWVHRYGDVIDLVAFLAGVTISGLLCGLP